MESRAVAKVRKLVCWISGIHATYYAVTGIWPIVHLNSFLAVTGPKTDFWLVQFFGALVCVPALALAHTAVSGRVTSPILIVAVSSTVILGVGDVFFVAKGTIGPIYLIDAAMESLLLAAWCYLGYLFYRSEAFKKEPTDKQGAGMTLKLTAHQSQRFPRSCSSALSRAKTKAFC
jgi:hypothetical protein